jgi:hypothetical protein
MGQISSSHISRTTGAEIVSWFRETGLILFLYLLATVLTSAYLMGDTVDYSESIVAHVKGLDFLFWEFGHLLWRPLGFLLFRVSSQIIRLFVGSDAQAGATIVLIGLSWLSGLVSVLSLHGILTHICRKRWAVLTTITAFVFAQAFLNYFHTGAPYVPGLSLVLLSTYLLVVQFGKGKAMMWTALFAGASSAGAVLLWFPYVLSLPAALLSPILLFGFDKRRFALSLQTAFVCAILTGAVYFTVMTHIGIHNVQEFRAWTAKTSRNSGSSNRGIGKMAFGFARSFINMGNDGMLFKRFLVHDPFNPVSALDLVRLSLWKLLAFYLFIFFILLSLISSADGRRVLALLAANGIPVIAFAVYWQGGDPERYLPFYPLLFIALAWSLDAERAKRLFKYPLILFIAAMVVTNGTMMARPRLNRQQEAAAARIGPVVSMLKSGSWIFTANWQDDLVNFNRSFPLNPINRNSNLRIGTLISPGEPEVAHWQHDFSFRVQSIWADGGDVWISRRLLSARPQADWNWVEGDDPRISWNDLYGYCSQLELGQSVGIGHDGFVLLLPSENNLRYLNQNLKS